MLIQLLQVDSQWEVIAKQPSTSPGERAKPHNMCYIIFTSGTTGRPKGAVLQHAGVINYLHCLTEYASLSLLLARFIIIFLGCQHALTSPWS